MNSLRGLMIDAFNMDASDIHLTVDSPPVFRIDGALKKQGDEVLTSTHILEMIDEIIPQRKLVELDELGETDFNYEVEGICRFRVNAYKQRQTFAVALRLIPSKIPTLKELGMESTLKKIAESKQGLVLITGPTGSGKTTTLAAMLDYINRNFDKHIITLEDPIEYMHENCRSVINQREIGLDTTSFAKGLRAALRQDPDVILVGEMRDLETISTAVTAAETGHLVFATLHTSTAASTIDRIIDVFPPGQQGQIRQQLANVILGIVSQRLLARAGGRGRVAATEILLQTPSVSNLIRSEKVHQLPNVLQTSKGLGMHTMQMDIQRLLKEGIISMSIAKMYLDVGEFE
ncbi:type IV pilus twitching motility protein PilT [Sporosarcina oncorhynchi]|uniref:Type IV pilus twitching motility protein PilT n=1 Tax=Sporosarcina oncorhynchi TaxID=3056444 RepID=A0ABZ0L977_9BACL|nr:type IV pilus twitching motility protein PilT [Sporosarcina sp. T2O-4]WOV88724.1 type IV pilus twitching motility protein PilT [Sporosarcina sp. T2O-4]